jgi:hypothetical protein
MKSIYRATALLVVGSLTALWAQDYPPQPQPQGQEQADDQPSGPGRGIARISVINGEVSVRRGNSGEVTAAALNAPLMPGDTILTSANARAELQFDSSSMLRIAANSEVRMGDLQYRHNQIQVALGLVTFTVLRNSDSQNEIDLPSVAVHPTQQGAYRIVVKDDGTAEITVRAGQAEIANPKGSQTLQAGQTMIVRGSQDDPEFQLVSAIRQDDWDRWNAQRDQELMRATSRQYVNPDITGAEDLDQHGRWVDDGSYGRVWVPQVNPDWAPYQDGRWTYGDDYGWTWIGAEPWGWAPYHYGRWYHSGFGWAWWPGAFRGPCYWSPALVGFFGFGGRVGFGFGFGSIGWVPLAPFEPFHRWWGAGYGRGFVVNNFNVYNTYRNARVAGGVRGVAAGNFGRGGGRFTAVGGSDLRSAGMVHGRLPVSPVSGSARMSDRSVNMSNFRQSGNSRFFSTNGSSSTGSRVGNFRGSQSPVSGQSGWNRPQGSGSQPQVRQGGGDPGWRRFNGPASGTNGGGNNRPPATNYSAPRGGPNYGSGNNSPSYSAPRGGPNYGGGNNSPNYSAPRSAPSYSAPHNSPSYNAPSYNSPRYNAPRSAPTYNPPSYSAPRSSPNYSAPRNYSGPSYSAPRSYSGPSYSAPRSAPNYSAPRSAPSYGGGGGNRGGGGGGGSHNSGGGGGGHRR